MRERLAFDRDGRDWPNRATSRFVSAAGFRWHVQIAGAGPVVLLLHGTGAATHSWRDVIPRLAETCTVIAPDLPGHGFTDQPPAGRLSLNGMAAEVGELMTILGREPSVVVGHSAGAAIAVRAALDRRLAPRVIVSLNGAFLPFGGIAGQVFQPLAKALALNPFVPSLFAWRSSDPRMIDNMMEATGSRISTEGREFYRRLAANPSHVAGALGMMAAWNLRPLERDLPRLTQRLLLVVGTNDRTVRPEQSERIRAMVPSAELIRWRGLGHLAHEERPEEAVRLIAGVAAESAPAPA